MGPDTSGNLYKNLTDFLEKKLGFQALYFTILKGYNKCEVLATGSFCIAPLCPHLFTFGNKNYSYLKGFVVLYLYLEWFLQQILNWGQSYKDFYTLVQCIQVDHACPDHCFLEERTVVLKLLYILINKTSLASFYLCTF